MTGVRSFASDNNAGVHPRILEAIAAVNVGHERAYGDDPHTARAVTAVRRLLGADVPVFFVFGGTGANVLGLRSAAESYHAVICPDTAHIHVDECGAPERHVGCKLLAVPTSDGKLRPNDIRPLLKGFGNPHHAQPRVIAVSQATELGTAYRPDELRALGDLARRHGMVLHMDGARIGNAAVGLGLDVAELTTRAGVDILTLGGTKNGLLGAEAVVFFRPELAERFLYLRKQEMQLASKMRFLACQFEALYGTDLWRENAAHANRLARLLADLVAGVPGVELTQPVEANAVFARIPTHAVAPLQGRSFFYVWDEETSVVRWMASFDTTEEDVRSFAAAVWEVVTAG